MPIDYVYISFKLFSFIKGINVSLWINGDIPGLWFWLHGVARKPNVRQETQIKGLLICLPVSFNTTSMVIMRIPLNLTIKKRCHVMCSLPHRALILDMFSPLTSFDSGRNCRENKEILSRKHSKFGKDDEQLSTNNDSRY